MRRDLSRNISVIIVIAGLVGGAFRASAYLRANSSEQFINNDTIVVPLIATRDQKVWLDHQITSFNSQHDHIRVSAVYRESRDAMADILYGDAKPVVWCADSPIWADRLNDVRTTDRHTPLIDAEDPAGYRVTMQSPMVFVTTKEKAEFLRPLLGGETPWSAVRRMANGRLRAPWGRVHFGFADPLRTSAGALTLAMIVNEYAQSASNEPISRADFQSVLSDISQISTSPYATSSSALQTFASSSDRADFIVVQENLAIDALRHHPDWEIIYPRPTTLAQFTACLVQGNWVTQRQRAIAQDFIAFLGGKSASHDAVVYDMRSTNGLSASELDSRLQTLESQGASTQYTAAALPPYAALNAAAYAWNCLKTDDKSKKSE